MPSPTGMPARPADSHSAGGAPDPHRPRVGEGGPPLADRVDAEAVPPVDPQDAVGRADGGTDRAADDGAERARDGLAALPSVLCAARQALRVSRRHEAERQHDRQGDPVSHEVLVKQRKR